MVHNFNLTMPNDKSLFFLLIFRCFRQISKDHMNKVWYIKIVNCSNKEATEISNCLTTTPLFKIKDWILHHTSRTILIGDSPYTVIILNIGTDRSEQTVQTQIRLLLMEQSDQGLLCLLFCLHLLNTMLHCKIQLFQLWDNYGNYFRCPNF